MKRRSFLATTGISIAIATLPTTTIEEDVTEIGDWHDLRSIGSDEDDDLTGNYILANDLTPNTDGYDEHASEDANDGQGWYPIGYEDWDGGPAPYHQFAGHFDGNGHTIKGLNITPDDDTFGEGGLIYMPVDANIEDLRFEDVKIETHSYTGLVGMQARDGSMIKNIEVDGVDVESEGDFGCVVGDLQDDSVVEGCSVENGDFLFHSGTNYGVISFEMSDSSKILDSYVENCTITCRGNIFYIGVVTNSVGGEELKRCHCENIEIIGELDEYDNAPGYVGLFASVVSSTAGTNIEECYVKGSIEGDFNYSIGGFTVVGDYENVENCFVDATINITAFSDISVGGFFMTFNTPSVVEKINDSYANVDMDIEWDDGEGDVFEFSPTDIYFEDCYYNSDNNEGQGFENHEGNDGITALTEDEMTGEDAEDNIGFDFNDVWQTTDNYPMLWWYTPPNTDILYNEETLKTNILEGTEDGYETV